MAEACASLVCELHRELQNGGNLEAAILATLPISVVHVGRLNLGSLQVELQKRAIPFRCDLPNRPLRGCLVAFADNGLIFIDSTDPSAQQRFTLAHETAHFVIDYLEPRRRAEQVLGRSARELLDGERVPTNDERISAFLSQVPIGTHLHMLERGDDFTGIDEVKADDLAFDLLAPRGLVTVAVSSTDRWDRRKAAEEILIERYGFPSGPARVYARSIFPIPDTQPLREKFSL